jgi:PEGA domain-containing protein
MTSRPTLFALIALLSITLTPACGTIINGTSEDIDASSFPSGAEITLDGKPAGVTPCQLTLERDENHFAEFRHPKYPGQVLKINFERSFNGMTFTNVIFGGLIGAGVDAASGANYSFTPDPVHADFTTGFIGDPDELAKPAAEKATP